MSSNRDVQLAALRRKEVRTDLIQKDSVDRRICFVIRSTADSFSGVVFLVIGS